MDKEGLSYKFTISETGAFKTDSGAGKQNDNLMFLIGFSGWFRVYKNDFIIDLYSLIQKNTNYLATFKSIILGKVKKAIIKYHPDIELQTLDYFNFVNDRKQKGISLVYTIKNIEENEDEQFIAVKILSNE